MSNQIKFLAYYLPQFHPIPENDEWWGEGFTEWTNVKKAIPLFDNHDQPIIPGELGYYDLLKQPEIQVKQAKLANEYGIDGFVYYHYWFGNGKMLLEKPAEAMLENKEVDLPFCFCWANETWKGIWHGLNNPNVLIEQTYPGIDDIEAHFNYLLKFFQDERYIKIDGKPKFQVYRPLDDPNFSLYVETFNRLAKKAGFPGIYFVAVHFPYDELKISDYGLEAVVGIDLFTKFRYQNPLFIKDKNIVLRLIRSTLNKIGFLKFKNNLALVFDYKDGIKDLILANYPSDVTYFPCILPNWDNSPRSGKNSLILKNANPEYWGKWVFDTVQKVKSQNHDVKIIIIKSWNEWAEGNHLEPDSKWGSQWLKSFQEEKIKSLKSEV